ncbi:MAG: amidase, partial [Acidimicrobiales bacterium]
PDPDDSPWAWRAPDPPLRAADGPLAGWRLAVKDLIAVAGRPLGCGSAVMLGAPAQPEHAPVVAALVDAGAALIGGTKLHEFGFGVTGLNAYSGAPANPAAPGRVCGGSSSGAAAAVAAKLADISLGTDTGGSVRVPAALCGVVGYKPSWGALDTAGVFPLAPSLDHVGWLAPEARRLIAPARVLGLLDPADGPASRELTRVGWAPAVAAAASAEVSAAFERALAELDDEGVELVEVDWPNGEEVFAATTAVMFAEAAAVHRPLLAARHERYGADVRARLVQGLAIDLEMYLRAGEVRRRLSRRCRRLLLDNGLDAVLTPTTPIVAPLAGEAAESSVAATLVSNTRLADLTGLPALSLPIPGEPLPVGLQLEALDDPTALAAAVAIERTLA